MPALTPRQTELLRHIIEEYVETAEPVGSDTVVEKFGLGVSPATIRNEMVELARQGFLDKPHTSAGRIPTGMAFRYYIQELMKEKKVPVVSETLLRQRLWEKRFEADKMLRDAVSLLAEQTSKLAIATVEDGPTYYAGVANILDFPEFFDIDLTKTVLGLLDQEEVVRGLFERVVTDDPIRILIGEEVGMESLTPCSFVFTPYKIGNNQGYLGILGPQRMHYSEVIPVIRFVSDLLREMTGNW